MITNEMLLAQSALNGLTDEQRQAIVTLSKNDEETVIGNRFREVYNRLDETIARETGIARDGDEKTYNYLERAAKALAAKANSVEGLNTKIHDLTAERDRLKKAIEENTGDEKLRKDLAQAVSVLLAQAVGKVKALKHEFIDDGNGGQRLVFKDANDAIMRNAEKQLEPYTIGDLLVKELKLMGVLDEGRQQRGAGTQPPVIRNQEGAIVIDLAGVKTQTEAQELIAQTLMKQGLTNGSKAFQEAMNKAWADNNISALPIK